MTVLDNSRLRNSRGNMATVTESNGDHSCISAESGILNLEPMPFSNLAIYQSHSPSSDSSCEADLNLERNTDDGFN